MSERSEGRLLFAICLFLLVGLFAVFVLDSDMLNRRIAELECRAGHLEKCGPPWNNQR